MAVNVDWRSIRPLNGGRDKGFEELCSQLARSEVAGRARFVWNRVDLLRLAIPLLETEGVLVREGARVRLPDHRPRMTGADEPLWGRLEPLLRDAGTRPPLVSEMAEETGFDSRRIATFLGRAAKLGLVVGATKNRYYLPAALRGLAENLEEAAGDSADGTVTAASFRDRAGIGRNLAIEVLEYFDKIRFTRRMGNEREILRPAEEVFGGGGGPERRA